MKKTNPEYVRVYQSIVDDEKFVTVFDDDHHLATWLRLLMVADAMWPASAHMPLGTRKASVSALEKAGLIDVSGSRFRVRGLDAERERRAEVGRAGGRASGAARTNVERTLNERSTTPATNVERSSNDVGNEIERVLVRVREEPSTSIGARDGLPHITPEAQRFLEELTGKPITTAGGKQLTEYDRQLEAHGLPAVATAYRLVSKRMNNPTARQAIWSALRVLEPFTTPQDIAKTEAQSSSKAGVDRTQRYLAELRSTGDVA